MIHSQSSTILIVDDNDSNIDILLEALGEDYDISVALDGETALEDIESNPPNLILLDIMMPGMNGHEVCKRLKSNERFSNIPIIFLTGMNDHESVAHGFELGAVDYITKPFQISELKARVKTHLELKQYRDHMESLVQERTADLKDANANLKELLKNERELTLKSRAAGKAKSDFMNIVSHELRTPLNAILGMNDLLLLSTDLDSQQKEYATIIKKSSGNLLSIINDILDFSEIDTGKLSLEKVDFRMDDIIKEIASLAIQKNAIFMIDIPNDIPNLLVGDPLRLTRVLSNLIDNAIKFSIDQPEIILGLKASHNEWKPFEITTSFYIKDKGIGLSKKDIDKLFKEPFTQLECSYSRNYGGLGLGLSICKSLVEMMDGQFTVESEQGKGSTFSFTAVLKKQSITNVPFEFPPDIKNICQQ
jgi:signal transduction histidine kinase